MADTKIRTEKGMGQVIMNGNNSCFFFLIIKMTNTYVY